MLSNSPVSKESRDSLIDGDERFTPEQHLQMENTGGHNNRVRRNANEFITQLWKSTTIPYSIEPSAG